MPFAAGSVEACYLAAIARTVNKCKAQPKSCAQAPGNMEPIVSWDVIFQGASHKVATLESELIRQAVETDLPSSVVALAHEVRQDLQCIYNVVTSKQAEMPPADHVIAQMLMQQSPQERDDLKSRIQENWT